MATFFDPDTVDLALSSVESNAVKLVLTAGEPTSFANADTNNGSGSGQKCVEVAVDDSDFTVESGDPDGRQVECGAQNGVAVAANGDADHWAWLSDSKILAYGNLASPIAVTTSGTVDIPATRAVIRSATGLS